MRAQETEPGTKGRKGAADTGETDQADTGAQGLADRLNDTQLADAIRKGNAKIHEQKDARKAINQDITAELSSLEAKGLSRLAIKHAQKIAEMSAEERNVYDLSMFILRRTEKCSPQIDMFLKERGQETH